ncbi:MAG: hypothetical protein SNJ72_06265 [Fimbriimonadales bacterium]
MKYRWSGQVGYSEDEARHRLKTYFETLGFHCLQDQPELALQRGSLWRGLVALSPRQIWMQVSAKIQPWGVHTLVDVTFEIALRLRRLHEPEAELLVGETREMVRYLQEGSADFERLTLLHQQALDSNRRQRRKTILLFALGFGLGAYTGVANLDWSALLNSWVGMLIVAGGVGFLIARLLRIRSRRR